VIPENAVHNPDPELPVPGSTHFSLQAHCIGIRLHQSPYPYRLSTGTGFQRLHGFAYKPILMSYCICHFLSSEGENIWVGEIIIIRDFFKNIVTLSNIVS
jgi:hypothetical protein